MPRSSPAATVLLHPTVTKEDVQRLVEALQENTRVREDELRERQADNALKRYTLEELAELTKVPEARIRRIVRTFPHIALMGGKKGRGNKATISRADAAWLVQRMGRGGLDELMEAEDRRRRKHENSGEQVSQAS